MCTGVGWGSGKAPEGNCPGLPFTCAAGSDGMHECCKQKQHVKKVQKRKDNVLVHPKARAIVNVHLCVCASARLLTPDAYVANAGQLIMQDLQG